MSKILGLDLGITSIGYAVVDLDLENKDLPQGSIIKTGVRSFEVAENAKDGKSLAEPRRLARAARRLIRRKAKRMQQVKDLFVSSGLIKPEEVDSVCCNSKLDPWAIRAKALEFALDKNEMCKVLVHIAKRRGFQSLRKSMEERDTETGKLLSGIKEIEERLNETKFKTVGELFKSLPLEKPKRNKDGSYENSVARKMLEHEVKVIFESQRALGNNIFSEDFESKYNQIAFYQRPVKSFANTQGPCSFEPGKLRAPKNSYTAEYFNALCKINNIRIVKGGRIIALSDDERRIAIGLCLDKPTNNYKQLRKILQLDASDTFNISYLKPKGKGGQTQDDYDVEAKTKIFEMKGFHEIRKAIKDKDIWADIKTNENGILDRIVETLCYYKSDDEIVKHLQQNKVPDNIISAVCSLSFSKFMHLSFDAMYKLIPHLERGLKYNEACVAAGYDFQQRGGANRSNRLRPLNEQEQFSVTSPVAKRTISQTIKVVNALNRIYGPFDAVHVELAREMGKSKKLRDEIKKNQKSNEEERDAIRNGAIEGVLPQSAADIRKARLWQQQGGFCVYSGKYIDPRDIFVEGYTQIDHIIPYSLSFDNSMNNLVLCITAENQNKRDRIPFDYFKQANRNWDTFKARVEGMVGLHRAKKQRLLKEELTPEDLEGFKERNLSDTKHITSFIKDYLSANLKLTDKYKDGVFGRNGRLTADLRGWWGLGKDRSESDKHHAVDAIVVACCSNGMMQYLSRMYRLNREDSFKHVKQFMPLPWGNFRTDVLKAKNDIFVSRPPRRKVTGALHKDTYYSAKNIGRGFVTLRADVNKLTIADIDTQRKLEEKYFGVQRNKKLYDAIEASLKARSSDKDAIRVFINSRPVRKVKMISESCSGVRVLKGTAIAGNEGMPRVDVFLHNGKYYIVPVYTIDFATGKMPLVSKPDNVEVNISDFVFSIYKDDYLEIIQKTGEVFEGYFKQYNAQSGQICLESHDRSGSFTVAGKASKDKQLCKNTFTVVRKYQIDILGNKNLIDKEKYVGNIKKHKGFGGTLK